MIPDRRFGPFDLSDGAFDSAVVRQVADRSTNCRLDTTSWGRFTIHANVVHRDGRETPLKHDLVLLYPDGTPTAA